jgi:hypothetical protein
MPHHWNAFNHYRERNRGEAPQQRQQAFSPEAD